MDFALILGNACCLLRLSVNPITYAPILIAKLELLDSRVLSPLDYLSMIRN